MSGIPCDLGFGILRTWYFQTDHQPDFGFWGLESGAWSLMENTRLCWEAGVCGLVLGILGCQGKTQSQRKSLWFGFCDWGFGLASAIRVFGLWHLLWCFVL